MIDLDRIEALVNAATPGPWTTEREEIDNEDGVLDGDPIGFPSRVGPIVLWDHAAGNDNVDRVEADVAFIVAMRDEAAGLVAELRAARAEIERLRGLVPELPPRPPEGDGVPRYGLRWGGPSQPVAVPMVDGYWTPWHLAEREIERLRTAAADERADVVAYMSRVAANLRRQRPRTDYLDTEADTYERASDAIADECHVGAAKGANHG